LEVNNAFLKITGLEKENVCNKKVTEVFPEIKKNYIKLYKQWSLRQLNKKAFLAGYKHKKPS
ncbi:MAG: PAS domain S-box protein, partial [Bacteroidales bacterium]|nr:PAS domain S-box protein [Bacteroidales bacterium]